MRNKIFNSAIVIVTACIFLSFFIFTKGLSSLVKEIKGLNMQWLLLAVIGIIIFWLLEAIILYVITKTIYKTGHLFFKSIKFAMIGQFFSGITPFASGSQPAQLYAMTDNGIPAGPSASILMIKFIIHQVTLTFYCIVVLFFKFNYFNQRIPYFLYFCLFGFVFNTVIIFFALLFSVSSKMTGSMLWIFLRILARVKLVKNIEYKYKELQNELSSFHENSAVIATHIGMCIYSSVLTLLQWTVYYSIPYFIYRSFGFSSADLLTIISAQVFLTMFMSYIPLPGAIGGAEGGFYLIFSLFFTAGTIIPAIFLWRVITYYSSIGAGSLFSTLGSNSKRKKRQEH